MEKSNDPILMNKDTQDIGAILVSDELAKGLSIISTNGSLN